MFLCRSDAFWRLCPRNDEPIFTIKSGTVMPEIKSNIVPVNRTLMLVENERSQAGLRLQLQMEIDRLALLTEGVKKQSARVQAIADAIGDVISSRVSEDSSSKNAKNSRHCLPNSGYRRNGSFRLNSVAPRDQYGRPRPVVI